MTVLIVVILLVPAVLFGSYRIQRARALKKKNSDTGTGSAVARLSKQQRRWDMRRLGYRYADDQIFVHGNGVFTGVVIDTSTDEFATSGETADTAMRPVGIYQALLGLFDGNEVHCQELVRYRPITTEGWLDQLLANAWHPTRMYRILAGKVAEHILHSTPQRMWALIVRLGDCPPPTGHRSVRGGQCRRPRRRRGAFDRRGSRAVGGVRGEPARRARPARRRTTDPPGPAVVDPQTRARAPAGR